jgi:hypothetical protein
LTGFTDAITSKTILGFKEHLMRHALPLTLILSTCLFSACSKKITPYTGETSSHIKNTDGSEVIQLESRSLLKDGGLAGREVSRQIVEADVEKVDLTGRKLTLKRPNGERSEFQVSPEIRNFKQIRPGDRVRLEFSESMTFEARKPTKEEISISEEDYAFASRAALGSKPASVVATGGIRIFKVKAINLEDKTLSLENNHESFTVTAKHPENLPLFKVGDPIVVNFSELLALSVETLKKK